jgi:hypothetical protein
MTALCRSVVNSSACERLPLLGHRNFTGGGLGFDSAAFKKHDHGIKFVRCRGPRFALFKWTSQTVARSLSITGFGSAKAGTAARSAGRTSIGIMIRIVRSPIPLGGYLHGVDISIAP